MGQHPLDHRLFAGCPDALRHPLPITAGSTLDIHLGNHRHPDAFHHRLSGDVRISRNAFAGCAGDEPADLLAGDGDGGLADLEGIQPGGAFGGGGNSGEIALISKM